MIQPDRRNLPKTLILEITVLGVSNDVLVALKELKNKKKIYGIKGSKEIALHTVYKLLTRVLRIILVIMPEHLSDTYVLTMKMEILLEQALNKLLVGDSLNLPDHRIHKDGDGDALFQLKSNSLPHAHAQTTKTYYKHQDSRIMKAQELKTKTSTQTLIYKIFLQRYQVYQGRLLASFQDDAKVLALETSKDAQAAEILKLKTRIKKLEKKCKPSISHHRAWLRSVSRLSRMKKLGKKESVSKQGRKNAKPGPTLDAFDDLDADLAHGMDYMETEEAVKEGRQSNETEELNLDADTKVITEDKGSGEKGVSTVSTARPDIDTARPEVHTANAPVSTAGVTISTADPEVSAVEPRTPPTTTSIFDDEDITMAQTLIKMKEEKAKEKGVAFKDVEDSSRPVRSITTLKPLPSIDPKDKGKGVLEEPEPAKKMTRSDFDAAQVARDAEVARQLEVELQAEVERERQREEQASMDYIANLYDEVQARIDADHELAVRLTHEEQEKYTVDERAKLLAEFFERRKKQLAEERAAAIRNKPPTRTQLRSLMMTYLKHTGRFKHSQLNKRTLEEIQALYIKEQERAANFVPIGSEEDERLIQKMNKKAAGVHVEEVLKEPDSTKVKVKLEEAEQGTKKTPGKTVKMKARKKARKQTHADTDNEHDSKEDERKIESMNKEDAGESNEKVLDVSKKRKGGPRMKRMSKRKKTESDLKEEEGLKTFLKIVPDKEGIIDYEVLKKRFPIINWESKFYHYNRHGAEGIYYRIFRYDGSSRWIKTFSEMVTRFDRLDLVELYNLVMQRFEIITSKGVDLVLWGDLRIMVHTLTLEDGTEIHMLAERKYPLTKETLKRMMSLKLIAESASDSAYDLLRFIQKQIDKAGSYDGGKKDL
ncbi:hypothetical protein Tco_0732654 [Tanacetum coccineum]